MDNEATRHEVTTLDSAAIDNRLLIALVEHTRAELGAAKWQLQEGLRIRHTPMGEWHLSRALAIVNALIGKGG